LLKKYTKLFTNIHASEKPNDTNPHEKGNRFFLIHLGIIFAKLKECMKNQVRLIPLYE
jgi:hypothetical protein